MFDVIEAETRESLAQAFPVSGFANQQDDEAFKRERNLFGRVKSREFGRPFGVPSHVASQKKAESEGFATDGMDGADPGTLAARLTGFGPCDGTAVLNENRGFTAGLFAQAETGAGRCDITGTQGRDQADVVDLRLGAAVGTG